MAEENGAGSAGEAGNSEGDGSQGGEGTEVTTFTSETWREAINSEWAEDASMSDFKTIDDLAKSYVHAQKLIGSDERIKIPTEDDSDNWMKFYNKIGRPEEASGYEFNVPEEAPDGYDSEQFQAYAMDFRKNVHDLGLTKTQAEALWNHQQKARVATYQEQMTRFQQDLTGLEDAAKKEFGQKLPELVKLRNNIINQYGGQEAADFLAKNEVLTRSPVVLKMFENLGKALGEDKITKEVKSKGLSPKEARSKINSLTTDKNHPLHEAYQKQWHPNHGEAVKEFNRLITFLGDE